MRELVRLPLGLGEDEGLVLRLKAGGIMSHRHTAVDERTHSLHDVLEYLVESAQLGVLINHLDLLLDVVVSGELHGSYVNENRIGLEVQGKVAHSTRPRSGEHQGLTVRLKSIKR